VKAETADGLIFFFSSKTGLSVKGKGEREGEGTMVIGTSSEKREI